MLEFFFVGDKTCVAPTRPTAKVEVSQTSLAATRLLVVGVLIIVVAIVVVLGSLQAGGLCVHVHPPVPHGTAEYSQEAQEGNELLTRITFGGDPRVALTTMTAKKCNRATHILF